MFVAVAMDAGGVAACKPLYEGAKASYVTLVDPQNALGDALGFKVIPNGFFIDEAGTVVSSTVGGFEVKSPRTIKAVEEFLAQPRATAINLHLSKPVTLEDLQLRVADAPHDADARLALGRELLRRDDAKAALAHLEAAAVGLPKSASAQFALATCRLANGQKVEAAADLKRALALDTANYVVRKQIWMLEHPDKFHPEIDWTWQREQLAKERKEEADRKPPPG